MYHPWAHGHGPTATPVGPATTTAAPRMDLDSTSHAQTQSPSQSQSSYQMSQMRWLPSMLTRSAHTHTHAHNPSLPTISSNLRLNPHSHTHHHQQQPQQHHHHQQQQVAVTAAAAAAAAAAQHQHQHQHQHPHQHQHHTPVSVVVDSRGQAAAPAPQQQQQAESVESEDSDRSESPGETTSGTTRDANGVDALGDPEYTESPGEHGRGRGDDDIDGDVMGGAAAGMGERSSEDGAGEGGITATRTGATPRKHGKRLTTKEEVFLFEICNRHAAEFGKRSNLCKWWMMVTTEFTRGQKHPYSWHSVRRKVEIVTKQRMKFLDEQREKGATESEDLSNPRWRAVVDAWIPTWQRWEEAEARRIEKRDSRRPRKRKWTLDGGWELPQSQQSQSQSQSHSDGASGWRAPNSSSSSPLVNHTPQGQNHTQPATPIAATSTPVRLPPGFENMFSSQTTTTSPFSNTAHQQNQQHTATSATNPPAADSTVMAAVLETLGKLNKHLDATSPNTRSSPLVSSLTSTSNADSANPINPSSQLNMQDEEVVDDPSSPAQDQISSAAISTIKEELRREMLDDLRSEWEKERAAFQEKLDSVQRTQEMILEMLRQEPT